MKKKLRIALKTGFITDGEHAVALNWYRRITPKERLLLAAFVRAHSPIKHLGLYRKAQSVGSSRIEHHHVAYIFAKAYLCQD